MSPLFADNLHIYREYSLELGDPLQALPPLFTDEASSQSTISNDNNTHVLDRNLR